MKTKRQYLLQSIENDFELLKERKDALEKLPIELVLQCFPNGDWQHQYGRTYGFVLPMSFALVEEVKEFCRIQGYTIRNERTYVWDQQAAAGTFFDAYIDDRVYIDFQFRSGREGSTCVLQKIGDKSVPIFEVVCIDGAKEGVFNV